MHNANAGSSTSSELSDDFEAINQPGSSRGRRSHHPFSDSCVRNSSLAYNIDIFLTVKREVFILTNFPSCLEALMRSYSGPSGNVH